jgi:hypothetical protein
MHLFPLIFTVAVSEWFWPGAAYAALFLLHKKTARVETQAIRKKLQLLGYYNARFKNLFSF